MRPIDRKIIKSGDIIEYYEYEENYFTGKKNLYQDENGVYELNGDAKKYLVYDPLKDEWKREGYGRGSVAKTEEEKKKNRSISLYRARNKIRRLVNANVTAWNEIPKFWTFTFSDNIEDVSIANGKFNDFIGRLRYHLKKEKKDDFEYIATIEKQKRGAIHYHCIFFNLPYIPFDTMLKKWEYGGAWVEAIFTNKENEILKEGQATGEKIQNVGSYMTKCMLYLTKEMNKGDSTQEDFLQGKKNYLTSRKLKKPIEEQWYSENKDENKKKTTLVQKIANKQVFESTYLSEHLGKVCHKEYNIQIEDITKCISVQEKKLLYFIKKLPVQCTYEKIEINFSPYAYEIEYHGNTALVYWDLKERQIRMIN